MFGGFASILTRGTWRMLQTASPQETCRHVAKQDVACWLISLPTELRILLFISMFWSTSSTTKKKCAQLRLAYQSEATSWRFHRRSTFSTAPLTRQLVILGDMLPETLDA